MPNALTPERYADTGGTACPACGGTDLARGGLFGTDADVVTRRWACENCGATWLAVYTLTWYDDLSVPTERPA